MLDSFYKNKKVLVTGHTGFKGSWLCVWLKLLGADVCGYSLDAPSRVNMFDLVDAGKDILSIKGDIRDPELLSKSVVEFEPDIVFHLAAQPLVRKSYKDPVETYSTNIMGTVNLFEALRQLSNKCAIVNITSDKCYENKEWVWGYRENDPMGGFDPYSSSKGCVELITAAYNQSYFMQDGKHICLASARAGNVIGGGDFGADRLVPDIVQSIVKKARVHIRFPLSVRPWQHVLEPLSGYMVLAKKLVEEGGKFQGGWNFGPRSECVRPVKYIVDKIDELWSGEVDWKVDREKHPHEANILKLECAKARHLLNWDPNLDIDDALEWTVEWYRQYPDATKGRMRKITEKQIVAYMDKSQI